MMCLPEPNESFQHFFTACRQCDDLDLHSSACLICLCCWLYFFFFKYNSSPYYIFWRGNITIGIQSLASHTYKWLTNRYNSNCHNYINSWAQQASEWARRIVRPLPRDWGREKRTALSGFEPATLRSKWWLVVTLADRSSGLVVPADPAPW